jgi:hypothetical protein
MTSNSTKLPVLGSEAEIAAGLLDEWFDPIEASLRDRVRELIQTLVSGYSRTIGTYRGILSHDIFGRTNWALRRRRACAELLRREAISSSLSMMTTLLTRIICRPPFI